MFKKYFFFCALVLITATWACPLRSYDAKAFQEAQEAKKVIIVHFGKQGCGTSESQDACLTKLKHVHKNAAFFKVDVEKDTAIMKQWKVQREGTVVAFKDGKEIGRVENEADVTTFVQKVTSSA